MLSSFEVHTATVETYLGAGSTGDVYAAPVDVPGYLDDGQNRVQSAAGEQLVDQTRFYAQVQFAAVFVPESRVTVNGRAVQVTKVRIREAGGMFALVQHVEVELT